MMTLVQKRAALLRAALNFREEADKHTGRIGQRRAETRLSEADWQKSDAFHARRAAEYRYLAAVLDAARMILDGAST